MRQNTEYFDGIVSKLLKKFESDPYSMSKSELEILKWFSKNEPSLKKRSRDEIINSIKVELATDFVKKRLRNED